MHAIIFQNTIVSGRTLRLWLGVCLTAGCLPLAQATTTAPANTSTQHLKPCPPGTGTIGDCDRRYIAPEKKKPAARAIPTPAPIRMPAAKTRAENQPKNPGLVAKPAVPVAVPPKTPQGQFKVATPLPPPPDKPAVTPAADLPLKTPEAAPTPPVPPQAEAPSNSAGAQEVDDAEYATPNAVDDLKVAALPDLFIYRQYNKPEEAGLPEGFPFVRFCGSNDGQGGPSKRIYFKVYNRGNAASPASKVRVRFVNPQTQQVVKVIDEPVPPLAPHKNSWHRITIPAGCYSSGSNAQCNFRMTADPDNQLAERFENNNVKKYFCVGPTN